MSQSHPSARHPLKSVLRAALEALERGEVDHSEQLCTKAFELAPRHPVCSSLMGRVLLAKNSPRAALPHLEHAAAAYPTATSLSALATTHHVLGNAPQAFDCIRKALETNPTSGTALLRAGHIFLEQGLLEDAMASFRRATAAGHPQGTAGMMQVAEHVGDPRTAIELWRAEPALERSAQAVGAVARCMASLGDLDTALRTLNGRLQRACTPQDEAHLQFTRGKLLDRAGDHASAFEAFKRANELRKGNFDPEEHRRVLTDRVRRWAPMGGRPASPSRITPVLIVGMPRSGSSLLEQMLSRHPSVRAGGELPLLPELARALEANSHTLEDLSATYQRTLEHLSEGAHVVTDKQLNNSFYLGPIGHIVPNARVIHMTRSPLDTCWSCYRQDFHHSHPYSNDLKWLGAFYKNYSWVMAQWHERLSLPIMDIPYEELVSCPERWVPKILRFCGLAQDPACARPQESRRIVNTASRDEVRQAPHRRSVGRSEPYRVYLEDLVGALQA